MKNILLTICLTSLFVSAFNGSSPEFKLFVILTILWFACTYFMWVFIGVYEKQEAESLGHDQNVTDTQDTTELFGKVVLCIVSFVVVPIMWLSERKVFNKTVEKIFDLEDFKLRNPIKSLELQNPVVIVKKEANIQLARLLRASCILIMNHKHNAHLKVGERVICTRDVKFCDGTSHKRGNTYTVEPDTQAYFSLFTETTHTKSDESLNYLRIE